jgi:hypothetical protein
MKYGFVYLWYDRKHKRFYLGCHWGTEDDGYVCSSPWMKQAYLYRPNDFKRRVLKTNILTRDDMFGEELRWLRMIKPTEIKPINPKPRYYNLNIKNNNPWHQHEDQRLTVGQKISKAKKGKSNPCFPEKAIAISEAKKRSFDKRRAETGEAFTDEHRRRMSDARKGVNISSDHKTSIGDGLKRAYAEGRRAPKPKKEQPPTRPRGVRLKELWADPVWAANQRLRLAEGAKSRPPRSEESKKKASEKQRGIPKRHQINAT